MKPNIVTLVSPKIVALDEIFVEKYSHTIHPGRGSKEFWPDRSISLTKPDGGMTIGWIVVDVSGRSQ